MLKAYKYRLYPNKEQQEYFAKCFGCVRFIYNRMLSDKIEYYKETKQKLNNTPAQYKKEFSWLEVKMLKKIKKQNKKIGEYPCVDYLHNALRLIKDNKLNQAYEEICFAILKSDGILTKEEQGNFENILKYVDK